MMRHILFVFVLAFLTWACDSDDPCKDVDCGEHGRCVVEKGDPVCECDDNYTQYGDHLKCEPESAPEKPIIYLYPEQTSEISVAFENLDAVGLTHTYPEYGEDGWFVEATPDGVLTDVETGLEFYGLYWEGTRDFAVDENVGFVVPGADSADFLDEKLAELGLTRREANEFIIYWLPRLESSPYNFIHFLTDEWNDLVPLVVEPEPNTVIRVLMAFQPLDEPIEVEPQAFEAPEREGFVLVEWGGAEL